jgi:hypothetical protein
MTPDRPGAARHDEIWALLAWYANGTLGKEEESGVTAHLAVCVECREELARCQALSAAVKASTQPTWAPSRAHWARVSSALDDAEGLAGDGPFSVMQRVQRWLGATPDRVRWTLAAQALLALVLAVALLIRSEPPQTFETLSRDSERLPSDRTLLRVAFAEDTLERELRALIEGVGGTIVQGPNSLGIYTIALANTDADELVRKIASLRTNARVRLVEPVQPAAAR